jgi:autotransporter-associated beta strand protein
LDFDGSAGSSTITTQPGGRTFFDASSDAGNSTIVTLSGGTTEFENNASGRNALLITDAGGITEFRASSDGGNAQLIVNAGGVVDFSQSSGFSNGLIEAGSIAGAGTFQLGSDELIVGSNDLSTKVSGLITDSGLGGGSLAALDKVGTGMLTLSHVDNDYTGGTFLQAGTLALTAIGAAGPGHITFAGRATLKVGKAALSAHHFGNAIDDFAKHDVVDLTGLHFVAGAIATYHKATHHLAVRSGGVTDTLTLFSPHGTHFEAANDHHGGTDVFLIFA